MPLNHPAPPPKEEGRDMHHIPSHHLPILALNALVITPEPSSYPSEGRTRSLSVSPVARVDRSIRLDHVLQQ